MGAMSDRPVCCVHPGIWLPLPWVAERTEEVARRAQGAGFAKAVVPLHDLEVIHPTEISRVFEKFGVEAVNSIGQTVDADVSSDDVSVRARGAERLRRAAAHARDMGSHHLGGVIYGSLGHATGPVSDERFVRTARVVGELADEFAAFGVSLACEVVNRYETPMLNTAQQGVRFVEASESDALKLHLDAFHMNIEEAHMLAAVDVALPHLSYLELSQNSRNGVAEGSTDLVGLVAHAWKSGFRGTFGLEAFSAGVLEDGSRLAIWRDVFGVDNQIAADAIAAVRAGVKAATSC